MQRAPPDAPSADIPHVSMRLLTSSLALATLAACAGPADRTLQPVESDPWPIAYSADAFSGAWSAAPREEGPEEASSLERAMNGDPNPEPAFPGGWVMIECRTLTAPTARVAEWAGHQHAAFAADVSAEDAERLARAEPADVLTAPRIMLAWGSRGTITVADQVAYVERFEVTGDGTALLADPVVGVASSGMLLDLTALPAPSGVQLTATAETADLQLHEGGREVQLPPAGTTVQLQQPVTVVQRVETSGVLAPGRQLALCAPATEPGRSVVHLLTASPQEEVPEPEERSSQAPVSAQPELALEPAAPGAAVIR